MTTLPNICLKDEVAIRLNYWQCNPVTSFDITEIVARGNWAMWSRVLDGIKKRYTAWVMEL